LTTKGSTDSRQFFTRVWRAYLLLTCVLSALVILLLFGLNNQDQLARRVSTSGLLIGSGVLIVAFIAGLLLFRSFLQPGWFDRAVVSRSIRCLGKPRRYGLLVILTTSGLILGLYLALLAPDVSEPFSQAILERLQPLALWGSGFCAQTLLLLVLIRHGPDKEHFYPLGRIVGGILLAVSLLFLSWNLVVDTAFSVESRIRGWNELGTPIIETQVILGWTIGMMLLAVFYFLNQLPGSSRLKRFFSPRTADILIVLLLWGVTVLLWNSVPLAPSWFVSEPRDANFEFYPNSDALKYDLTSQGLLVGENLQFIDTPYIRRPVHALFLTALHLVGGQDYMTVTTLQIMVLALIPVLVYLLVGLLHNRVSGALAGVLIMLREANSIAIAETVTTSHARLLMSDLPAALCLVALVYVLVLWLRNPASHRLLPVLAGGLLGACILIRPEMGVLLLPILFVVLINFWTKRRQIIRTASLFIIGAGLIISPW
jgi:hypothetical protein